jgi:hypothetical protein
MTDLARTRVRYLRFKPDRRAHELVPSAQASRPMTEQVEIENNQEDRK